MPNFKQLKKKMKYVASYVIPFHYYNRMRVFGFDEELGIKRSISEKLKIVFSDSEIVIPFMDMDITTFCNLRCKRCAKCIPYFDKHRHFTAAQIAESLGLLTKYVDKIYVASILGGEPFLNPELAEILKVCAQNTKIEHLEITTNASIEPTDEQLRIIRDFNIDVHISDYRSISDTYKQAKDRFVKRLEEYGIKYEYQFHDIWLDFGEIEKHEYTDKQLHRMYVHCPMNSCAVFNDNKLYKCGHTSYLSQHGMVEDGDDVIDLKKVRSRREMKARIRKFYSVKYAAACQYCLSYPAAIPAGEQLEV